jgi:hypothetical protein
MLKTAQEDRRVQAVHALMGFASLNPSYALRRDSVFLHELAIPEPCAASLDHPPG